MGYSGTIKNVITNITTQNDIYVNITSTTRMHIYKEDLDKTWYIVACEVLKNKKIYRRIKYVGLQHRRFKKNCWN